MLTEHSAALALETQAFGAAGSRRFTIVRLIQFYVPRNFKLPKRRWPFLKQRGKIIDFRSAVIKKSA